MAITGLAGQILHVTGSRLRFTWDDVEQGIFFIPYSTSAGETRVGVYSHIGSAIVGKIPDLDAGEYGLLSQDPPQLQGDPVLGRRVRIYLPLALSRTLMMTARAMTKPTKASCT